MVFEILKNSLRAVVETHGSDAEEYPQVKVIVAEGNEDITVKISDEGGGIPRSAVPLVWTYMYTTADTQGLDQDFEGTDFKAPMAGFGASSLASSTAMPLTPTSQAMVFRLPDYTRNTLAATSSSSRWRATGPSAFAALCTSHREADSAATVYTCTCLVYLRAASPYNEAAGGRVSLAPTRTVHVQGNRVACITARLSSLRPGRARA